MGKRRGGLAHRHKPAGDEEILMNRMVLEGILVV